VGVPGAAARGSPNGMPAIEILPVDDRTWAVRLENDSVDISRHRTRAEAETSARSHAEQFGYDRIVIWGKDAEREVQIVEPLRGPDTPADVKGPAAR
jgi:hypothetical protein